MSLEALRAVGSESNSTTIGRAWMQISRSGDATAAMNVYYSVRPASTATAGVDYQALSGWVTIPAGRMSVNVPIVPIDDSVAEDPEVIVISLLPGKYDVDPDRNLARFYIADNDSASARPTVGLTVERAVADEADPARKARLTFTRTGSIATPLNVSYALTGTAVNGVDYQFLSGIATIPAGQDRVSIEITAIGDALVEPAEWGRITLNAHANYNIDWSRAQGLFYIADNTAPAAKPTVGITVERAVADEADPARKARLTFTRIGSTANPLNINYALTGTAVNGVDYQSLSGIATIPAGQDRVTLEITAIDDGVIEPAEWGRITLNAHANYTIDSSRAQGLFYIADSGGATAPEGWWDTQWHYRTALTFNSGSFARTDKPFVVNINFTNALAAAGGSGALITQSLRVVETDASGSTVINSSVPFQFDPAAGFNAASNAAGQLVIIATGNTAAGASRHYHVYFDTQGTFSPAAVTPRLVTTDNVVDQGQASVRIATSTATYFYQKDNGGFSSILDADGNDWVSFQPGGGSAGEYRGIPNAIFPGGGFHPGFENGATTIVSQGPLRTVLRTDAIVDQGSGPKPWSITWEFYPTYATCTFTDVSGSYWFLYEGTPGGAITPSDYIVRSDGTNTPIDQSWTESQGIGSENGSAWLYFGDSNVNRYLFMAQHTNDNTVDSYWLMEGNMTVFGFGRGPDTTTHLTGQHTFTIGLADGGAYAGAAATINGAYRDATVNVGASQKQ